MGSIHLFAEHKPLDLEAASAMAQAFDTAWDKLLGSESPLASSAYAEATREALAMHMSELSVSTPRS